MRLLLSPKWMAWHVLTLGAMVTCGFLAAWQWGRAGSAMGSALNIGYGLQWPLFAVFFGVMWWRFLRMEITTMRAREAGTAESAGRAVPPDVPEGPARPAGDAAPAAEDTASAADRGGEPREPGANGGSGTGPERPSPFTARPAGVTPPRSTDPQLQAYNEELARLAARQEETTS
ncbi:hypothetical protein [Pseudonocardia sp. C8]|uniref:hypothetical protein n=1 Tax=Pseudonocardia sp. C8 TaxID=2762759 RepID=UPI002105D7A2|nr:hypothetical protein [Pseudonocardia sp. C8]